jgi:hypothetical protein
MPTKEGADLGPCRQVVPKLHADHLIDKHESSTIGDPLVPKVVNIVVPKQRAENNPDEPEDLTGDHFDVGDQAVLEQHFPRLAAFRRDHPELGLPELR